MGIKRTNPGMSSTARDRIVQETVILAQFAFKISLIKVRILLTVCV